MGTRHNKGIGVGRDKALATAAWEWQPEEGKGSCCQGSWVKAGTALRKGHGPADRSHSDTARSGIARLRWSSYRLFQRAGLIYNPKSDFKLQRCSSSSYHSAIRLFLSYNYVILSTCLFSPKTHLGSRKRTLNSIGDQGLGNAQLWRTRVGGLNCWEPSTMTPFFKTTLFNSVDVEIKLTKSRGSFCWGSSLAAGAGKKVFTHSFLSVKKLQMAPGTRWCLSVFRLYLNYTFCDARLVISA